MQLPDITNGFIELLADGLQERSPITALLEGEAFFAKEAVDGSTQHASIMIWH